MKDFRINWHRSINFGDQLNPYLINHFLDFYPEKYEKWNGRRGVHEYLEDPHFMMLGSILNEANKNTTVIGAGFSSENSKCIEEPNFISVRGRLTLDKINGLYGKKDVYIGDPGILLPKIYKTSPEKKYELGVIPHIIDEESVTRFFNNYSRTTGKKIKIISLRCDNNSSDIERIINEISSCESTISSSLHGLILSHSYNVPSLWVEFSDRVIGKGFKFRDYFSAHLEDYKSYHNYNPMDLRNLYRSDLNEVISRSLNSYIDLNKHIEASYEFYFDVFTKIKK